MCGAATRSRRGRSGQKDEEERREGGRRRRLQHLVLASGPSVPRNRVEKREQGGHGAPLPRSSRCPAAARAPRAELLRRRGRCQIESDGSRRGFQHQDGFVALLGSCPRIVPRLFGQSAVACRDAGTRAGAPASPLSASRLSYSGAGLRPRGQKREGGAGWTEGGRREGGRRRC